MQKQKNKQRGITLIALVVTVIVLIILAGVSIAMLVGENGIITQAQRAEEATTQAMQKEAIELAVASVQAQGTIELDKTKLETALQSQLGDTEYDLTENGDGSFLLQIAERSYYIDSTGEVITEENMIAIGSTEELKAFRDDVNSGNTYEGKYIYLTSDITLDNSEEWVPIGLRITDNSDDVENKPFKGIFNGNNHEINGIYINTEDKAQGLFGFIRNSKISNLTVGENNNITGGISTGGVCGYVYNSIIFSAINKANIYGNYGNNSQVGGIAGTTNNNSIIINSCNFGNINSSGHLAGGIIGYSSNTQIISCFNAGSVTSNKSWAGGIVASIYKGKVEITNCYNISNITGVSNIGGIIGDAVEDTEKLIINNCYNVGNITGDRANGIYGHVNSNVDIVSKNNYCLNNTVNGNNGTEQEGVIIKDANEMRDASSLLGKNFKEDQNNINNGYPILKWQ